MSTDITRAKLDWLHGLKGIRERRLRDCMDKKQWPEADLDQKRQDIGMIDAFIRDYDRVLERQMENAA